MSNYFEGCYFKHQKGEDTLCLIVGSSNGKRFIQVITREFSATVPYTRSNLFSEKGIRLNIRTSRLTLTGKIRYKNLSPIRYNIMGIFSLFPMECSHGIVSMRHLLEGNVCLNGRTIDFTGGLGYIEKDSGKSFPSSYLWIQANDFSTPCSIMAAVARIPFLGTHFQGCICVIQYNGKEYRFATYLGVKILALSDKKIHLKQGKYQIIIKIRASNSQKLKAPEKGKMTRIIQECASCPAEFLFIVKEKTVFHLYSRHASFEYEFPSQI